jgi:hypothetical protein
MHRIAKVSALSLVISLFVLNTACKKDSAGGSSGPQKLRTYTEDITAVGIGHVVENFNVSYDGQGRITSITSTTKPGHRYVYQYLNNNAFTYEHIEDNKVTLHCDYFINGEVGMVDSVYTYNIRKDTISFKYFYNSDNKIIKQKEYLHSYIMPPVWYNTIDYIYDLKGTLTKKAESSAETSYRYDEDHNNTVGIEPSYIPMQEKLPSHTYSIRFNATTTTEHSYTFDGQKRVISEKAVRSDGRTTIKSYTYQ